MRIFEPANANISVVEAGIDDTPEICNGRCVGPTQPYTGNPSRSAGADTVQCAKHRYFGLMAVGDYPIRRTWAWFAF